MEVKLFQVRFYLLSGGLEQQQEFGCRSYGLGFLDLEITQANELLYEGFKAEEEKMLWDRYLVEQPENTSFIQYKDRFKPKPVKRINKARILEEAKKAEKFFKSGGVRE